MSSIAIFATTVETGEQELFQKLVYSSYYESVRMLNLRVFLGLDKHHRLTNSYNFLTLSNP